MAGEAPGVEVWTVYDHPSDMADWYVARMHLAMNDGTTVPTSRVLLSKEVEGLRAALTEKGLLRIERDPQDDPKIVESWI